MPEIPRKEYAGLDRPEILALLFHPRPEWSQAASREGVEEILIPVEGNVRIGARFHLAHKRAPIILFFHGNGEIVADYDDLGQVFVRQGLGFFPVDYRGYGRSGGRPSVSAMMGDAHGIFAFVREWIASRGHDGPLLVMGRSLGSASALELAAHYPEKMDGLIIESGFARARPLLEILGIHAAALGFREEEGFLNLEKMRRFEKPTLIIHAEKDHLIPLQEGRDLYGACAAKDKRFLIIPGANHNDIFMRGLPEYMEAVKTLASSVRPWPPQKQD